MNPSALTEARDQETGTPLRVLLLEHDQNDVDLLLAELKGSGLLVDYTLAENKEQFVSALQRGNFDAILSDYRLPTWNGLEALKELRASGKDIPFLLVTGTLGEEAAVECIKQGVHDCVLKDHLSRAPGAVRRAIQEKALRDKAVMDQAALADSEARTRRQLAELDFLYRTMPICLCLFDRDLRFVRVNEEVSKMDGLTAAAHVGLKLHDVAPQIADTVEAYLHRVFRNGESILNVEVQGPTRLEPNVIHHWLASYYPHRSEDGTLNLASSVAIDITQRHRSEEALRLSEARNRDLVEHSAYGIFRIAVDGSFLDYNPAITRILGCSTANDLRALNLVRDIFRYPEQYAKFMMACREQGQVHGAETEWRRRDGGMVAVRLHLRWVNLAGQHPSVEVIAEDVTEVRAMERQLRQVQKFEAIGQLAGGIAHDFNNVVGAILGWAELGFEQSRGNPQVAERFSRIREQAGRAAVLTRELLAFARRQVLQARNVDLNSIASSLVTFLDKVIGKDIQFKVITAPVESIKADATQIEQVLMNLCLNARDAMPEGGRLMIETEMVELDDSYCHSYPHTSPGRYAVLSVSDTGVGMDTETRERIFEPFFTTKEREKGSGMGLATVYGIVRQHGGFIHVYSEPGQGSLFRAYFPVVMDAVSEAPSTRNPVPTRGEMRGTETVLLAEDHESIREMARQTLLSLGYRVLSAADGEEALRLCESETPAIAVLDVVMPKLGGTATAAKLLSRFADLPVLLTSGYSQDSAALEAACPSGRYLQKPYSPTMLGRLVREILDQAKQSG